MRVLRRLAPDRLAQLGARLLAEEEVHERHVRLVAARHLERLLDVRRGQAALHPGLLGQEQAEAPVDDVVVVHHEHAQVAVGAHSGPRILLHRHHEPHAPVLALRPELHERAALERLDGGQPQAHAGAARGHARAPSFRTSSTNAPSMRPHVHAHRARPGVLVRVPERLGEHRLRERLDVLGHLHALLPVELERQVLVVAAEPGELASQRRARVERRRRERPRQRLAEVRERRVHLVGAAPARLLAQRVVRARARARRRTAAAPRARAARARGRCAPGAAARGPAGSWRSGRSRRAPPSCRASTGRGAPRRSARSACRRGP